MWIPGCECISGVWVLYSVGLLGSISTDTKCFKSLDVYSWINESFQKKNWGNHWLMFCMFRCSLVEQGEDDMYDDCSFTREPSLENGKSYTFKVYAVDSVGNIGQPVEHNWLVGESYRRNCHHISPVEGENSRCSSVHRCPHVHALKGSGLGLIHAVWVRNVSQKPDGA